MVSEMAMEEIAQMRAEGVAVTDRDVIRLNALAIRYERCADAAPSLCQLPRVAFLGDVAIREPSIAAEIWLIDASRHFDCTDASTFLALRAFSLARDPGKLPSALDVAAVRKAVKLFAREEIGKYTVRQAMAAIEYATEGADPNADEYPAPDPDREDKPSEVVTDADGVCDVAAGVLYDGVALRLGSASELSKMTESALTRLIAQHLEAKGGASEVDRTKEFMEYERTKDEIIARGQRPSQ